MVSPHLIQPRGEHSANPYPNEHTTTDITQLLKRATITFLSAFGPTCPRLAIDGVGTMAPDSIPLLPHLQNAWVFVGIKTQGFANSNRLYVSRNRVKQHDQRIDEK